MTVTDRESLGSMPPTTWSATCDPYNRWATQDATSVHPLATTGRITSENLVFFPSYVEPPINTGKILAKIRPLQEHWQEVIVCLDQAHEADVPHTACSYRIASE
jgi:hypothetical protein